MICIFNNVLRFSSNFDFGVVNNKNVFLSTLKVVDDGKLDLIST